MPTDLIEETETDLDLEQDGQQQQDQVDQGTGTSGSLGTSTKPGTVPPNDELKTALAELAGHVKTITTPKQQPQELSPEQKAKYWGVWNPTEKNQQWFDQFFGFDETTDAKVKETRLNLFKEMQEGLVRQAMVGAMNLAEQRFEQLKQEWESQFGDVREFVSTERAEKTRNKFYNSYPALNDPRYAKTIDLVAREIADQQFRDEAHYFQVLAESTAGYIKGYVPDFELGAAPKQKPAGTTPRLPRTSVGGSGGAGGGTSRGGSSGPRDDSDGIFDE